MPSILTRAFQPPKFIAVLLLAATLVPALSLYGMPPPGGRVTDLAGVLDAPTRSALQAAIQSLESRTNDELFVVTVKSLEGLTVEDYANKLFNQWGIGKKGKDNGILVLVCPSERKVRIEVGYGLEATIPDGVAGGIIRSDFIPKFKEGNFGAGIQVGVSRLVGLLTGESPSPAPAGSDEVPEQVDFWTSIGTLAFLSIFLGIGYAAVGYALRSKQGFFLLWGGMFGGIPTLMVLLAPELAGPWRSLLVLVVLGALVIGYLLGRGPHQGRSKGPKDRKGGWTWGSGSGGSSGGGSSSDDSSGGDGGGGGSSGGGGASGSW